MSDKCLQVPSLPIAFDFWPHTVHAGIGTDDVLLFCSPTLGHSSPFDSQTKCNQSVMWIPREWAPQYILHTSWPGQISRFAFHRYGASLINDVIADDDVMFTFVTTLRLSTISVHVVRENKG